MAKKGQNLVNAIDTVNGLPAIDFNASIREVQDALIECQPSIPDPSGTAQYGANNEIKQYLDLQTISRASAFICSGSGNAYVLTTDTAVHLRQFTFIQKYSKIHFIASFTNTGACTANVDFFGIRSIKLADGSDPLAGHITANNEYTMYCNDTNWVLTNPTISSILIGDYKHSAQTSNHNGWLICNGQAVSRTTYASLFAIIGTSFGIGDNLTTFNLPDARGRVSGAIGQGSGLTNRALGANVGEEMHTQTINEMPSHNHSASNGTTQTDGGFFEAASGSFAYNIFTNNTGGGQPFNVMQPTLFIGNLFIYSGV